jgi:hypothetical protein
MLPGNQEAFAYTFKIEVPQETRQPLMPWSLGQRRRLQRVQQASQMRRVYTEQAQYIKLRPQLAIRWGALRKTRPHGQNASQ